MRFDRMFDGPPPQFLHHYTKSSAVVESIVRTRSLWATCIADQFDQTEISHASEITGDDGDRIFCFHCDMGSHS
jgi:hypothetical protein